MRGTTPSGRGRKGTPITSLQDFEEVINGINDSRIVIVLAILRQALGAGQAPPNQVLIGLSLFLTLFVMGPIADRIYTDAYVPYSEQKIAFSQALDRAQSPLKNFMLKQTRQSDVQLFATATTPDNPVFEKAKLAKEAQLPYALVALVTDYDCWRRPPATDVGPGARMPSPGQAAGVVPADPPPALM